MDKILRTIIDLIFPPACLGCGKEGSFLCDPCLRKIPLVRDQVCPVCKKPSWRGTTHGGRCQDKTPLSGLIIAAKYTGNPLLERAITRFKYHYSKELEGQLGRILAEAAQRNFTLDDAMLIVPIPLHTSRKRWRGFNQAEALAEEVGKALGIPVARLLARRKKTRQQARLTRSERLENVKGAFEVTDYLDILPTPHSKGGAPKRILLVDDVASTLATLEEAAKVLRQSGYTDIIGLVLARG